MPYVTSTYSVTFFYLLMSSKLLTELHFHYFYHYIANIQAHFSLKAPSLALELYPSSNIHIAHAIPYKQIKSICWGALTQPPCLPWMKSKSTKTWSAWGREVAHLSKEKGPEPFPPWAFIRFIHTGIQIKLINHCQAVRVKQYIAYRELWGLILSYSQLVKGL